VSAPQPAYQNGGPSRPEVPPPTAPYASGDQPDGSRYGAAAGYLPANGYNGNGNAYPGRDHLDGQSGYGAYDHQNLSYQDVDYQPVQPMAGGYPQSGQYNERGYGEPDVAYVQDGYQGYPGYGPGGR
jgi:hypothetical protein